MCLRSLRLTHPGVPVTALHDYGEPLHGKLCALNPNATLIYSVEEATKHADQRKRISAKLDYWSSWMQTAPDGEVAVFLDADMLVRGNLSEDLANDFDVLITLRKGKFPLNSGLVAVRVSQRTRDFFDLWRRGVYEVFPDPDRFKKAMKAAGGIDQFVLLHLLGHGDGISPRLGRHRVETGCGPITVYGANADVLNQAESVPLSAPAKVLHYKGGWHHVLTNAKGFIHGRTWHNSSEMYWLWHEYLRAEETAMGLRLLNKRTRVRHRARELRRMAGEWLIRIGSLQEAFNKRGNMRS